MKLKPFILVIAMLGLGSLMQCAQVKFDPGTGNTMYNSFLDVSIPEFH